TRADIQMLLRQARAVMTDKRLCGLFGPDALAEAAISGKVGHLVVQGQVDRLVVRDTDILLADFKTGTPPVDKTDMPVRYVRQMAVYAELLSQIYPAKKVKCWVIWTQTAEISIISDAQIQEELASLIAQD
ncbi:MAG: PD-(D/E)XK nuclease family protein, partial [Candidatus Puniceispirillaceae bacterium]